MFLVLQEQTLGHFNCKNIEKSSIQNHLIDSHPYYPTFKNHKFTMNERDFTPLVIELNMGNTLKRNTDAAETFRRASSVWNEILKYTNSDKITIDVDFKRLDSGVLGSTQSIDLSLGCEDSMDFLDSIFPMSNNVHLPNCSSLKFDLPGHTQFKGNLNFNKAHMKALGLRSLDEHFGKSDGHIKFNTRFIDTFDFDISNGIDETKVDFYTVCLHEIGHILGFKSGIDSIDSGSPIFIPTLLDLYRFKDEKSIIFASDKREANPYVETHIFYPTNELILGGDGESVKFSTGMRHGDSEEASHWKADEMTGKLLGIMDPSLKKGSHLSISINDITAMRAIGYDIDLTINPRILFHKISNSRGTKTLSIYADNMFLYTNGKCNFYNELSDLIYDFNTQFWKCRLPLGGNCNYKIINGFGYASELQRLNC